MKTEDFLDVGFCREEGCCARVFSPAVLFPAEVPRPRNIAHYAWSETASRPRFFHTQSACPPQENRRSDHQQSPQGGVGGTAVPLTAIVSRGSLRLVFTPRGRGGFGRSRNHSLHFSRPSALADSEKCKNFSRQSDRSHFVDTQSACPPQEDRR